MKERILGKEMYVCTLKRCIFYKGMCVIRGALSKGRMLQGSAPGYRGTPERAFAERRNSFPHSGYIFEAF